MEPPILLQQTRLYCPQCDHWYGVMYMPDKTLPVGLPCPVCETPTQDYDD